MGVDSQKDQGTERPEYWMDHTLGWTYKKLQLILQSNVQIKNDGRSGEEKDSKWYVTIFSEWPGSRGGWKQTGDQEDGRWLLQGGVAGVAIWCVLQTMIFSSILEAAMKS